MSLFAKVNPSEAMRLTPILKADGIPFTAKIVTEETGLCAVELSAKDEFFDSACSVAEAWYDAENKQAAANAQHSCPQCRSIHLKFTEDCSAIVIRCADCGYSVAI